MKNAAAAPMPPPRGWGSVARTARAPIVVLAVTAFALLVPPQTHDMLAYLNDGYLWRTAAFHLALMGLGFNAWYWARAALAARFGADDTPAARLALAGVVPVWAYTTVPRLLFGAAAALGAAMLVRSEVFRPASIAVLLVWAVLLYLLLWTRLRWQARLVGLNESSYPQQCPARACKLGFCKAIRERFLALLDRAPLGTLATAALLGFSLLIFLAATVESFSQPGWPPFGLAVFFARLFPGPAAALFGLGLMIGPLATATFVSDGLRWPRWLAFRRPPIVIALVVWIFVLMPRLFDLHTVRIADGRRGDQDRIPLADYFSGWVKECAANAAVVRPVIVAVSGGATMAGIWGARVLHDVADAGGGDAPAVFAVSSVSGGSLGTAAFMSLLAAQQQPCAVPAGPDRAKRLGLGALQSVELAGDALGPVLNGWLLGDIPRAVFGAPAALVRRLTGSEPRGGDSAAAIEHGFEYRFSVVAAASGSRAVPFSDPFLSLFYAGHKQRPGMPLWIANGTDATTGSRLLTVPVGPHAWNNVSDRDWPFGHAYDVLGLLRADVPISTAINNTARFPFLEPFGVLLPHCEPAGRRSGTCPDAGNAHEVIDGGYFENEGMATALELAGWLRLYGAQLIGRTVEPIIVQATAGGTAPDASLGVMRCRGPGPGPHGPTDGSAWQLLAPLIGLNSVRGGHSAVALRQAYDSLCGPDAAGRPHQKRFFHFYLGTTPDGDVPLNWVLSEQMAAAVWRAMDTDQDGNLSELHALQAAFASRPAPGK